jgi:peptidoglycan/LPS O-acetylase OafA/YrhL
MRLASVDTLRGIAAMMVVVYHITGGYAASPVWTAYGFTGVYLFFVISGFCIHLRAARGQEPRFGQFWRRRLLRLYPAYLASIVLYIWWSHEFSVYDLVMHLLMLHNFDPRTVFSMNGVWWTLAIEEQLYALYFVLLWMRKRWNWTIVLSITFAARFGILAISLGLNRLGFALPFQESALANWWIWAIGALAVEAYMGKVKLPPVAYSLTVAVTVFVVAALLYDLGVAAPGTWVSRLSAVIAPPLWGLTFFCVLNRFVRDGLSVQVVSFIGLFSYSLYLTHEVVIGYLPEPGILVFAACLAFAYLFFLLFEKPFMHLVSRRSLAATIEGQ